MPPFRTFDGYLKRIDGNRLTAAHKSIFELAFSAFYSAEDYNERAINQESYRAALSALERNVDVQISGRAAPFKYRRFSGGPYLPRGRYYSVCRDASGDDRQALAGELFAYYRPDTAGEIALLDLDGANAAVRAGRVFFRQACGLENPEHVIAMQCQGAPGLPSPILNLVDSPRFIPGTQDFVVFLQTEVVHSRIPNVIDLRFPDVQEWLYETLLSGIPQTLYMYGDELSCSAFYPRFFSEGYVESLQQTMGALREGFVNPANEDWDGERRYYVDKRLDLFSFLMYSSAMGGSPVTNAIGRWLQSIGTDALVYPSARADVMCNVQDDQVVDFAGFLLVDYRGGTAIPDDVRIICEPYSWKENWGHLRSDGDSEWSSAWKIPGIARGLVQVKLQQIAEYYRSHEVSAPRGDAAARSHERREPAQQPNAPEPAEARPDAARQGAARQGAALQGAARPQAGRQSLASRLRKWARRRDKR